MLEQYTKIGTTKYFKMCVIEIILSDNFNLLFPDCGNWNGPSFNSVLRYTSGTTYKSIAISTCKTGFNVIGQPNEYTESAECMADGYWSKPGYLGCEAVGEKLIMTLCFV